MEVIKKTDSFRNFARVTEKDLSRNLFLKHLATSLERRPCHKCFPLNSEIF